MISISKEFSDSISSTINAYNFDSIVVLADTNTANFCYPLLKPYLPPHQLIIVPAGEENKNMETAQLLWSKLIEFKASRNSVLINLGGGMVTDLGGFAASIFQRGISFIHFPTSLLSMVDASIGSKTGIDFLHFKNYLGSFSSSLHTFIITAFLNSLPPKEILNGWAEVMKHGIISGGKAWELASNPIPQNTDGKLWLTIINENIAVKSAIVAKDPTEQNLRKTLNLGHTLGHALESAFLESNNPVSHGYCVAAGILMESYIAKEMNLLESSAFTIIKDTIIQNFSILELKQRLFHTILQNALHDKKNKQGEIRMSLPTQIGNVVIHQVVTQSQIQDALKYYVAL